MKEAGGRRQKAGGRRQEAGGRRQEAGIQTPHASSFMPGNPFTGLAPNCMSRVDCGVLDPSSVRSIALSAGVNISSYLLPSASPDK
ncbi:hypothetical protein A4S05_31050 [Nostoc sp. KVJ20]|nr:hypothetical protein A4S05_31050 [Nostoc sp. KVJ20]